MYNICEVQAIGPKIISISKKINITEAKQHIRARNSVCKIFKVIQVYTCMYVFFPHDK